MSTAPVVVAHGGGVPEAAMIGLPLLLFGVFILLERRARRRDDDGPPPETEPDAQP